MKVHHCSQLRACCPLLASLLLWGWVKAEHHGGQHPWNKAAHFEIARKQSRAGELWAGREEGAGVQGHTPGNHLSSMSPTEKLPYCPISSISGDKDVGLWIFGGHFKSNCNNISGDFFPQRLNTDSFPSFRSHPNVEQSSRFVSLLVLCLLPLEYIRRAGAMFIMFISVASSPDGCTKLH